MRKNWCHILKPFNYMLICEQNKCTGCSACLYACKHGAISMMKDVYGFEYPHVDKSVCIQCGACSNVCPQIKKPLVCTSINTYACYSSSNDIRRMCSSGGFATQLSLEFVKAGGVVYGCSFVSPMQFKHIRCTSPEEVYKLRGSKYVQSNIVDIYADIKNDIKNRQKILFIGTPCQVAGVKAVFGRYAEIYFVDLICHGVPSVQFLCDTLPDDVCGIEKSNVEFRASTKFHFSMISGISTIYERPIEKDLFFKGFFTGVLFRESCFSCRFARKERISDITIGDFWKLKSDRIKNPEQGVSLVLVNSDKGMNLFNLVKEKMTIEERTLAEALAGNEQLNHPFKRGWREKVFKKLYPQMGFKVALWITMPDRLAGTMMKSFIKKYI